MFYVKGLFSCLIVSVLLVGCSPAHADPQDNTSDIKEAGASSLAGSSVNFIREAFAFYSPNNEIAGFPFVHTFDFVNAKDVSAQRIFVTAQAFPDNSTGQIVQMSTTNGSGSFTAPVLSPVSASNIGRLDNGDFIALRFNSGWVRAPDGSILQQTTGNANCKENGHASCTYEIPFWRSADSGVSWTKDYESAFFKGENIPGVEDRRIGGKNSIAVHRGIIRHVDPTTRKTVLLAPAYAEFEADIARGVCKSAWRAFLIESSDGVNWAYRGTIRPAIKTSDGYSYVAAEPSIVQLKNGNLKAVMRYMRFTTKADGYCQGYEDLSLLTSTSTDGGKTWSAATNVLMSVNGNPASARSGVDPSLHMMPNGVLLLVWGRYNDNNLAYSLDDGNTWTQIAEPIYANYPKNYTMPLGSQTRSRMRGSSGYMGIGTIRSNRALLIGDNCAPGWGCKQYNAQEKTYTDPLPNADWLVDDKYKLFKRYVSVLTPGLGKLDLAGMYRSGALTLSYEGGTPFSSSIFPEARIAGAFDGSTQYHTALLFNPGATDVVITFALDRLYSIDRIGILAHRGRPGTAMISLSADGTTWTEPNFNPALPNNRSQYALEYSTFAKTQAKYVRVTLPRTIDSECDPSIGAGCASLNELEIYADDTLNTFENDNLNAPPRGFVTGGDWDTVHARVVEGPDIGHSNVLELLDNNSNGLATAQFNSTAAATKTFEFDVKAGSTTRPMTFSVRNGSTLIHHFLLSPNGSISQYRDGVWLPVFVPAGGVDLSRWSRIQLIATNNALVRFSIDGLSKTGFNPLPATSARPLISALSFGSSGTEHTGTHFFVDNVAFY